MPSPFSNSPTAIGAFFELLRDANPGMDNVINEDNVNITAVQGITPVNGLNTQVTLEAKPGNDNVSGTITLRYRRLALSGIIITSGQNNRIRKIFGSPANQSLVSEDSFSVAYRKRIADTLGIFWDNASDFSASSLLAIYSAASNNITLTASGTNLCYTGSFVVNFPLIDVNNIDNAFPNRIASQELELMENADVAMKLMAIYPTNSNGLLAAANTAFGTANTFTNTTIVAGHQPFFNVLNTLTGLNLRADVGYNGAGLAVGGQYINKLPTSSGAIQLRKNGVLIETALNARYKSYISQKWGKVLYIDRFYTGWQKTGIVIPLIPNL